MHECRELKEQMHAALDGELAPAERQSLMEHVGRCAECDATWRSLSAADGWLGHPQMAAPTAGFAARVRVRAEMRRQARRNRLGWLALGAGTLVVALIAGGVSLGWFREAFDGTSPSTWMGYGPVAAQGVIGAVSALLRGAWLFVRGIALYAHVNWMLMCVAGMSLVTGMAFVASYLVQESTAARRRSVAAVREGNLR